MLSSTKWWINRWFTWYGKQEILFHNQGAQFLAPYSDGE